MSEFSTTQRNSSRASKTSAPSTKLSAETQTESKTKIAVTIGVPVETAYGFFREVENVPRFMKGLKAVEIVEERTNEMISWKTPEGAAVAAEGTIWFSAAPQNMGTIARLAMDYKIPGGKIVELFGKLAGKDPDSLAIINLHRFKCLLETGEIATIEGQSSGREAQSKTITRH